ncbi:hypothetical protein [Paenibacillus sp. TY11]|uniref:hypothetical protein n=1 Tax=Paenibacillus sp. TY11 TaxID=3448633 RepID=UPI00403A6A94
MRIHLSFILIVIKKIWWFKAGRPLRVSFDLTIAVAVGFFELNFKGKNPTAKANASLLQIQMNRYAANRLKGILVFDRLCGIFTHKRICFCALDTMTLKNNQVERERSGRNGAVQALAFAFVPRFQPLEIHKRNLGTTAMGSTIRLRSGASFTSLIQSYLAF